ncbi:hypothetical protein P170DRAFT_474227 [Aspergillus steynii IBT 23096]|uniref:Uncharacterized protein n=1 Tax=Aspergillus steynii IBT 23096 TaxID=1392250 RepID=A0A2I2GCV4_9EURO|nr:uncharacterized protein P170DRAFT_474227 [Aspergillus steynii IBT 23096]PLB50667.1 hypothetical protein P170DRAFT_474227 [Aspergillus steynii IBT 23096]
MDRKVVRNEYPRPLRLQDVPPRLIELQQKLNELHEELNSVQEGHTPIQESLITEIKSASHNIDRELDELRKEVETRRRETKIRLFAFLSWADQNHNPSAADKNLSDLSVLGLGADVVADAQMLKVTGLKECELFNEIYSCSVSVAQRLQTDQMTDVLKVVDVAADCRLMQRFQAESVMLPGEQAAFARLKACLDEIDPEHSIPVAEVMKMKGICEEFRAVSK